MYIASIEEKPSLRKSQWSAAGKYLIALAIVAAGAISLYRQVQISLEGIAQGLSVVYSAGNNIYPHENAFGEIQCKE